MGGLVLRQRFGDYLGHLRASYKLRTVLVSDSLVTISVCLLLIGFGLGWRTQTTNTQIRNTAQQQVAAANHNASSSSGVLAPTDVPSTTKPSPDMRSSYSVAPNLPKFITIPKLGIDARIIAAGTDKSGAIATPSNVYDTAWYNGSSLPGEPGAMLIDGHISSWTTNGVFHDLKRLQAGDVVQVERGDGTKFAYRVVSTKVYDVNAVDMNNVLAAINPSQPGLNLISCFGEVIKGTNEFNKRIVVFTEQV